MPRFRKTKLIRYSVMVVGIKRAPGKYVHFSVLLVTHSYDSHCLHQTTNADVDWENYWNPELVVQNLIKETKSKVWRSVDYSPAGEAFVLERRRISGEFSESMELQSFPFDTQVYY